MRAPVSGAQRKGVHPCAGAQLQQAALQVICQTVGTGVARVGGLGQQTHHQIGHLQRHPRFHRVRRGRHQGHLPVGQYEGIAAVKGRLAQQQFIEHQPQAVQVAARVHLRHATGLLG
jgi:hypothetical protein